LRNPILVAQTATSLDVLSGGRVILGVGAGDTSPELAMYGCDASERGKRCDEALAIIKRLWTQTDVTFRGRFYRAESYHLAPRPTQQPHPPLVVGGHEDRVLRRAARWADGFLPTVRSSAGSGKTGGRHGLIEDVAGYAELYEKVERYARELGRDPGGIERMLMVHACLGPDADRAARTAAEVVSVRLRACRTPSPGLTHLNLYGPPARCRDALQRFIDIGVTHFAIHMTCPPAESLTQLEELADRVVGPLR
jgi:alkanesulfonate monooxygenase SsuD/methylene tetrahydromethanopterin reductase-like flavin-dependent oxidoreductase (luciferase family)